MEVWRKRISAILILFAFKRLDGSNRRRGRWPIVTASARTPRSYAIVMRRILGISKLSHCRYCVLSVYCLSEADTFIPWISRFQKLLGTKIQTLNAHQSDIRMSMKVWSKQSLVLLIEIHQGDNKIEAISELSRGNITIIVGQTCLYPEFIHFTLQQRDWYTKVILGSTHDGRFSSPHNFDQAAYWRSSVS